MSDRSLINKEIGVALQNRPEWAQRIAKAVTREGIRMVAYVPDAAIGEVIASLPERVRQVPVGREEEAIGVVAGGYLAGSFGAVLAQNTGIGNSVNALASYAVPAEIPMLLVVNHRGDLTEFNPCQVPMGLALHQILDSLGIPHFDLAALEEVDATIAGAVPLCLASRRPLALVLRASLTGGKKG